MREGDTVNVFDRAVAAVAPVHAAKRAAARAALKIIDSGYGNYGANLTKKSLRGWEFYGGSAKEDIEDNIDILRQRSRDAYMGIPTASAALKTMRTNVIAGGLMISNNYIPEKINDANAYLDGTRMIGVAASVDLPEINMKTGTVEGFGIGGEVDSPTIGQWERFEQVVQFNTLYSSAVDMLSPMSVVNLTFRAAQQVYDKSGGYDFKGLRVVEMARVKKFKPGKIEKSEGMEAEVTVEVTYIMIEVDGEQLIEIDKLNGVYKVKGVDMLAKVRSLI